MDEIKAFLKKYPQQTVLVLVGLLGILFWLFFLTIVTSTLHFQNSRLKLQMKHILLLKKLPANWQAQTKATDITDLLDILSNNWKNLLPQYKNVRLEQQGNNQLKLTVKTIDEQRLMQWLWAMQKQYSFKIVSLHMSKLSQVGIVNADMVLQII
jgi:hypothetical protein